MGGVCEWQTHVVNTGKSGKGVGRSKGRRRSGGQRMEAKWVEGSRSFSLSRESDEKQNMFQ